MQKFKKITDHRVTLFLIFLMLVRVFYVVHRKAELFFGDDCDDSGRSTGKERSGIYQYGVFLCIRNRTAV